MFTIYQIVNKINGKSYIGFTSTSPHQRWTEHKAAAHRGEPWAILRAIRKYGDEAFRVESLEEGWDPKVGKNIREPYWISILKPEYNETLGGDGTLGYKHTLEAKRKISETKIGRKMPPKSQEERRAISARQLGVPKSLSCRLKLSISRTGMKLGPQTKEHIAAVLAGKMKKRNKCL